MRAAPLLVLIVLAGGMSGSAQAAPPALWLVPGEAGPGNFTVAAPNASQPQVGAPLVVTAAGAEWIWKMAHVPEPYTLTADADVGVVVFLRGLATVVPLPNPDDPVASLGNIVVRAHLMRGGSGSVVASGVAYVPVEVNGDAQAVHEVVIDLEVAGEVSWNTVPGDRPEFGLQLFVDGRMDAQDPVVVLTGSVETPSRLEVARFPVQGFAAWEAVERAEAECNARVLQGLPCEDPTPEATGGARGAAAVPAWLALAGVAGAALAMAVRARRER